MSRTTWRPPVKPPVGGVELDAGHPLAQGLAWGLLLNEGAGAFSRAFKSLSNSHGPNPIFTVTGTPTWTTGPSGLGQSFNGSSGYELDPYSGNANKIPFEHTAISVAVRARRVGAGAGEEGIFTRPGVWRLTANSFGDQTVRWLTFPSTRDAVTTSPIGNADASVGASVNPTTMAVYFNGRQEGTDTGDTLSTTSSAVINVASGIGNFNGVIYYVYFWGRDLTAGEFQWLHAEPYAFLRPLIRRRYFLPAAGANTGTAAITLGALTMTAAGLLSITGQAGVTLGGLTTTATGALPVAGVAAITLEEIALGATGDLAIAGEAAITLGALTAHGFDAPPTISAGRRGHSAHRFIRGRGRPH